MIELNDEEIKIIVELSDEKGHCNWELAELLNKSDETLSKITNSMVDRGIIYKERQRHTTNPTCKGKKYPETPLYIDLDSPLSDNDLEPDGKPINKDLVIFSSVLNGLINSHRILNSYGSYQDKKSRKSSKSKKGFVAIDFDGENLSDSVHAYLDSLNNIFKKLTDNIESQNKFLCSAYVNGLIKKYGFFSNSPTCVYNLIRDYLHEEGFEGSASLMLWNHPSVKEEYSSVLKQLREDTASSDHQAFMPPLDHENHISILANLDREIGILFYRMKLEKEIIAICRDEAERSGLKNLTDFMELDIHLNPFISYPINFPPALLLRRPFERLYDDIYIFGSVDFKKLMMRAYIFYNNFAEFFSSAIRHQISDQSKNKRDLSTMSKIKNIESIIRQAIFYWNVSSFNFDWVCTSLEPLLESNQNGKYYIKLANEGIYIEDLGPVIDEKIYIKSNIPVSGYFIYEMEDMFGHLRPSEFFKKIGLEVESMTYERIISEFNESFNEG